MEPQRQALDLSWGRVSYLQWDTSARAVGPDVLLLHGGGLDSAWLSWGGLGSALSESGYRVIAPDHPGYGQSPPASWTATQDRLVSYVGEFVDALGLHDYVVGGVSLGGGMTIGHLLTRPDGAKGAVLVGSYGLMDHQFEGILSVPAHVATWAMLRTGMISAIMRAYGKDRKKMENAVRNIIRNPAQRTSQLVDAIMVEAENGAGSTSFEEWQRDQFLWDRLRTNYTGVLDSLTVPTLIVHGDHDTGVPVLNARIAAQRIPDAWLVVVPDAGHWVQRDRPEVVTAAVIDFLEELA